MSGADSRPPVHVLLLGEVFESCRCLLLDSWILQSFPTDRTSTRKKWLHHFGLIVVVSLLVPTNIKHQHVNTPQEAPGPWLKHTC